MVTSSTAKSTPRRGSHSYDRSQLIACCKCIARTVSSLTVRPCNHSEKVSFEVGGRRHEGTCHCPVCVHGDQRLKCDVGWRHVARVRERIDNNVDSLRLSTEIHQEPQKILPMPGGCAKNAESATAMSQYEKRGADHAACPSRCFTSDQPAYDSSACWAAASFAIGIRNGEQLT